MRVLTVNIVDDEIKVSSLVLESLQSSIKIPSRIKYGDLGLPFSTLTLRYYIYGSKRYPVYVHEALNREHDLITEKVEKAIKDGMFGLLS